MSNDYANPQQAFMLCAMANLPLSKGAFDRLGERLARQGGVPDDDVELFTSIVSAYEDTLTQVEAVLVDLGYRPSARVKTTAVLIEKLVRESSRLSQVQDFAGARIVLANRLDQDRAVQRISERFDGFCPRPSRVKDRRHEPSHGYRAVHLVVFPDGNPVEIQVRTELQDRWAQIVERLADSWGRGIRYGEPPEDADALINHPDGSTSTRRDLLEATKALSLLISKQEELHVSASRNADHRTRLDRLYQEVLGMQASWAEPSETPKSELVLPDVIAELLSGLRTQSGNGDLPEVLEFPLETLADADRLVIHLKQANATALENVMARMAAAHDEVQDMVAEFARTAEMSVDS
ncbi:hypothetical protein [Herbidospora yilanensis]|uniref:hypothetical protein n=1 Tax=Herbidospora yilanensis TaxID=354426 RepID=UPI00078522BD|nr:hypothetical protein [Herbidospora yilanensis]